MKAAEFKDLWIAYMNHIVSDPNWLDIWNNDSKWTSMVQNTKSFSKEHWIQHFLDKHEDKVVVESEYRKIDFVAASVQRDLAETMANNGSLLAEYPFFFLDTIVEFENDFAACFQEMIKLTQLRGKLKVLITYDYPHKGDPENHWVDIARRNWRKIICESQGYLPEPGVEYLLAIGQLSKTAVKDESPDMKWYFSIHSTSNPEEFVESENQIQ